MVRGQDSGGAIEPGAATRGPLCAFAASLAAAAARARSSLRALAVSLVIGLPLALGPGNAVAQDGARDGDEGATLDGGAGARMTMEEARRVLAEPAPQGVPAAQEAPYWVRRQQAAYTVGDGETRIAALRRLVVLTTAPDKVSPFAGYLWREIQRNGNQTEALELGERLVDDKALPTQSRALFLIFLAQDYLYLGDLPKARSTFARAEREAASLPGTASQSSRMQLTIETERLRSSILQQEADLPGAEAAAKKSLAIATDEVIRLKKAVPPDPLDQDRSLRTRDPALTRLITVYVAQGKSAEAEVLARLGIRYAQEENVGGSTLGYWYGRLAQAKLAQRRYQDAYETGAKAVEIVKASGVAASADRLLTAQYYLLQACFGLERWAEADGLAAAMREATAADAVARIRTDSPVLQSFLHLVNGRVDIAFQRIDGTAKYRGRNYGEAHPLTIEAKTVRAMVYQAQGQTRAALLDYDAVFRSIFAPETTFADAEPAGLRGFYAPLALRAYLRLVETSFREGGARAVSDSMASDAFRVADRLRASVVQQALIDSSARVAASNPEMAERFRREQDERRRMRDLIAQVATQLEDDRKLTQEFTAWQKANPDPKDALAEKERAKLRTDAIRQSRDGIAAAEKARGEIVRDVAKRFPEYQALVNPKPPTLDQVAELLDSGEVLVSIFPTPTGTFVWAAGGNRGQSFHFSPLKQADVKALVAKLRAALDQGDRPTPGSLAFDAAASHRLYGELVAPFGPRLVGARSLVFAVNGDLAQIPLAVLLTEAPVDGAPPAWLVRTVAVSQVSTVAAFSALRRSKRRTVPALAFMGFGDPVYKRDAPPVAAGLVRAVVKASARVTRDAVFSDADYAELPPLPETRDEILGIARALGADPVRDTLLGAQASREAVLGADLATRRVVAFATHGLKPGDLPGLSRPALALSAPKDPNESPLLVLDDVMALKLNADWVVLSACNTASDDGRAEEALSGLARGFFFAGARSVLATHWAVESRSAQELVTRIFDGVARDPSRGRAEALRQAQLELIDGKAGAAYRHPFFWAPYARTGDPAR
jgi:CHAT domain-containing protein